MAEEDAMSLVNAEEDGLPDKAPLLVSALDSKGERVVDADPDVIVDALDDADELSETRAEFEGDDE